ncbi:cytochrome P450 [Gordonia sp. SID5947]|uniref:cytochrome P450 n=1 Tax=Gordonia sp. SID5947 TaxID=2690315 RepID=UPI0013690F1F|nr:cytochrome P450 [Gordonia sp. SID5947]MYR07794.1 cytochrome P450 [Gordonia sp. SID5947]
MHDLDEPYGYFSQLRDDEPVHRLGDSSFFLVTSWELISEVVSRHDEFSSNLTATMVWHPDGTITAFPIAELGSSLHALATADDPTHRTHRALVMPSLVARRVSRLETFIAETLNSLWTAGLHRGRIDWVGAVAQRLPMCVVAELLGFPAYDIDDLVRWSFASTVLLDGLVTTGQIEAATQAVGELSAYLSDAFAASLERPGQNVMGDLARTVHGGDLDQDTAVIILFQLVAAGAESTVSLIGSAAWLLGRHPDIQQQVRADIALLPRFIEEALRLESPFRGHYRHVVADTTLGGVTLPAGSRLYLSWAAANRDDARYDAPNAIDLGSTDRRSHMAFGKGIHLCIGAALARLESRIALEHLLDATATFDLADDEPEWERSLLVRRLRTLTLNVTA